MLSIHTYILCRCAYDIIWIYMYPHLVLGSSPQLPSNSHQLHSPVLDSLWSGDPQCHNHHPYCGNWACPKKNAGWFAIPHSCGSHLFKKKNGNSTYGKKNKNKRECRRSCSQGKFTMLAFRREHWSSWVSPFHRTFLSQKSYFNFKSLKRHSCTLQLTAVATCSKSSNAIPYLRLSGWLRTAWSSSLR